MIEKIIKTRRSISSFKNKSISLELIDELINISSYAPSSCNTQPWFFLVFNSNKSKNRLNEYIQQGYDYTNQSLKQKHQATGFVYSKLLNFFSKYGKFNEAPIYILLFARPYDTPIFSQAIKLAKNKQIEKIANDSVKTSSAMLMQNFLLLAHEKGLGTRVKDGIKFMMDFGVLKNRFYDEFDIPFNYELISGIQLGYPSEKEFKKEPSKRLNLHKIRKII